MGVYVILCNCYCVLTRLCYCLLPTISGNRCQKALSTTCLTTWSWSTGPGDRFEKKTGSIDGNAPPILLRIGIAPEHWIELCTHFEERFKGFVGSQHSLKNLISSFGLNRKTNHSNSRLLYCWRLARFSCHIYVDPTINELSLHGRVFFPHQISDFPSFRPLFLLPAANSLPTRRDLTMFWRTEVGTPLFYSACPCNSVFGATMRKNMMHTLKKILTRKVSGNY